MKVLRKREGETPETWIWQAPGPPAVVSYLLRRQEFLRSLQV